MAFVDHSDQEYFEAYRINFRDWRIVDIDNFMDGNNFFSDVKEESVWEAEVEKRLGSPKVLQEYEKKISTE